MAADCIIGLDAGTSGVRCVIVRSGKGKIAATRREWEAGAMPDAAFGWSFDAASFWKAVCEVTAAALAEARLDAGDIDGIGVTSQRLGLVVLDDKDEEIFAGPNIDARAFAEGLAIDADRAAGVYAYCGKLPSLLLAPAKLQWLRKQRPESRPAAVLSIADWVAYKLTGVTRAERTLSCDNGLASATTGEYDTTLLDSLGVPRAALPQLVSGDQVASEVSPQGAVATGLQAGTPVVIAGADTQVALLGMGVTAPGDVGIVAGWSCPLQMVTPEPRFDTQRRTWVSLHAVADRWVLESSAADAGRAWHWWCDQLLGQDHSALAEAAKLASEAAAGSLDALAFLGPGAMNAGNMSVQMGGIIMTAPVGRAGREQMLRAGLENVAYAMRANLEQAEEVSGVKAARVTLGGGFTRTALFAPMLASVLGREIAVARDAEVSARGAALLAARALRASDDSLSIETKHVAPIDSDTETYKTSYARWRHVGAALSEAMKGLP